MCIVGVGILVTANCQLSHITPHSSQMEFGHAEYSKDLPDIMENAFCCHFPEVCEMEHSR